MVTALLFPPEGVLGGLHALWARTLANTICRQQCDMRSAVCLPYLLAVNSKKKTFRAQFILRLLDMYFNSSLSSTLNYSSSIREFVFQINKPIALNEFRKSIILSEGFKLSF